MTNFLGTWIDIVLLARAYVVVRSGSGFSVFASQLCMMPSDRIYNNLVIHNLI